MGTLVWTGIAPKGQLSLHLEIHSIFFEFADILVGLIEFSSVGTTKFFFFEHCHLYRWEMEFSCLEVKSSRKTLVPFVGHSGLSGVGQARGRDGLAAIPYPFGTQDRMADRSGPAMV